MNRRAETAGMGGVVARLSHRARRGFPGPLGGGTLGDVARPFDGSR